MRGASVLLGLTMLASACGYRLGGSTDELPTGARTVSIQLFRNHTREHGLDVRLQHAIEDEFRRHSTLKIADDGADLVLSGDIRRFASVPVAFSATDEAVQYQGILQVSFRLTERATGKVVSDTPLLQATQDFGAVSGVVVTSSPNFQRGTIDSRDLVNLTNVQIGGARRRDALRGLLDLLAHDVYQRAVEGF
jgi:lipopolysaccharide assembly LptE-like protein